MRATKPAVPGLAALIFSAAALSSSSVLGGLAMPAFGEQVLAVVEDLLLGDDRHTDDLVAHPVVAATGPAWKSDQFQSALDFVFSVRSAR